MYSRCIVNGTASILYIHEKNKFTAIDKQLADCPPTQQYELRMRLINRTVKLIAILSEYRENHEKMRKLIKQKNDSTKFNYSVITLCIQIKNI